MMREPWYWPMMEPPLPNREADWENGVPWLESGPVAFGFDPRENLVMEEGWND